MKLAQTERAALCDLLIERGPEAPTLCEGWTTGDLAAHLWVRENDPVAASGIMMARFAERTDRRMAEILEELGWPGLVAALRQGPPRFSLFGLPGADEAANALEFFVHHEDVRRAGEDPLGPRDLPAETQDFLWARLRLLGRAMLRKAPVAVTLERPGPTVEVLHAKAGRHTVTLIGQPSEFVLFAFGRSDVAQLQWVGSPEGIAALKAAKFAA